MRVLGLSARTVRVVGLSARAVRVLGLSARTVGVRCSLWCLRLCTRDVAMM